MADDVEGIDRDSMVLLRTDRAGEGVVEREEGDEAQLDHLDLMAVRFWTHPTSPAMLLHPTEFQS